MKHLNMKMRKKRIKDQGLQHCAIQTDTSNIHQKDRRAYEKNKRGKTGWCEEQSEKDQMRNRKSDGTRLRKRMRMRMRE